MLSDFYRGDTKNWSLTFTKNGSPIDVSNMSLYFTLKQDEEALDNATGSFQVSVTFPADANSVAGLGSLLLTSTFTNGIAPGTYFYDFQLVDSSASPAVVTTLAKGTVNVLVDITRTTA
jgi:hypothetical protein